MNLAQRIDFAALMEPVALALLGEPNARLSKPPKDIRFGTHGSMSVDYEAGRFFDHENNIGGGVIDLIKHKNGCDHSGAVSYLRANGFLKGDGISRAPHLDRRRRGEPASRLSRRRRKSSRNTITRTRRARRFFRSFALSPRNSGNAAGPTTASGFGISTMFAASYPPPRSPLPSPLVRPCSSSRAKRTPTTLPSSG